MARPIYIAKLKTAGKTHEQILAEYEGPRPSDEFIQNIKKAYDSIDGLEVAVLKSGISEGYVIGGWQGKDDHLFRDFIYQAEQDEFFGTYVDDYEGFLKAWMSGEYEPMGSLTFDHKEVEILEKLEAKK